MPRTSADTTDDTIIPLRRERDRRAPKLGELRWDDRHGLMHDAVQRVRQWRMRHWLALMGTTFVVGLLALRLWDGLGW